MKASYSKSHGTKRVYITKGYHDMGWLIGFNTRFGGRCLWVYQENETEE